MRLAKTVLMVLVAALLVGGAVVMAQAAEVQGGQGYNGSAGPDVSYPPDYNGIHDITGWAHNLKSGDYTGDLPGYSQAPSASGWMHADPQTGWFHVGPSETQQSTAPSVPVRGTEGPDIRTG